MFTWSILLVLAAVFIFWYRRHNKRRQEYAKSIRAQQRERNRFHSVEIRPRGEGCIAVKQQEGLRYLSSEAPRLPLPGCTKSNCTCRYVHYVDRRQEERRMDFGPSPFAHMVRTERRAVFDRRQSTIKPRLLA